MRFPFNLRPLLLIPKVHNPKGLALFVIAWLNQYRRDPRSEYLESAETLLKLLLQIRSRGDWAGSCWGYHYPWQDAGFYAPRGLPNAVVTAFVCEAFLEAHRVTGKHEYLDTVSSAIRFFLKGSLRNLSPLHPNSLGTNQAPGAGAQHLFGVRAADPCRRLHRTETCP